MKRSLLPIVAAFLLSVHSYGASMETPTFERSTFFFSGRWTHQSDKSTASTPAVMVQFNAQAKDLYFEIEGQSRWRLDQDGKPIAILNVDERKTQQIKVDNKKHLYRLIKISESNPGSISLYRISTDKGGTILEPPKSSNRRIEFIGDSYTVGYGVEGKVSDPDDKVFITTNTSKSYAFLLADSYKADFQINAFSGRGLVRNYDNIVPDWDIERLYQYRVPGEAPSLVTGTDNPAPLLWKFDDFHPQAIVLFIGINDFQGNPPYANKEEFKKAYSNLLDALRSAHPGVKFLLLSTKVWPNDDLTPTVKAIFEEQKANKYDDIEFLEVHTENTALHGHPNENSQKELANTIRPIIGRLVRWLAR